MIEALYFIEKAYQTIQTLERLIQTKKNSFFSFVLEANENHEVVENNNNSNNNSHIQKEMIERLKLKILIRLILLSEDIRDSKYYYSKAIELKSSCKMDDFFLIHSYLVAR